MAWELTQIPCDHCFSVFLICTITFIEDVDCQVFEIPAVKNTEFLIRSGLVNKLAIAQIKLTLTQNQLWLRYILKKNCYKMKLKLHCFKGCFYRKYRNEDELKPSDQIFTKKYIMYLLKYEIIVAILSHLQSWTLDIGILTLSSINLVFT